MTFRSHDITPPAQLADMPRGQAAAARARLRTSGSRANHVPTARHCLVSTPLGRPCLSHSRVHSACSQIETLPKWRDPVEKDAAGQESRQPHPRPSCWERKEVAAATARLKAGRRRKGGANKGRQARARAGERGTVGAAGPHYLDFFLLGFIQYLPAG